MATISWPDALPYAMPLPLRAGYGLQYRPAVLRTEFDGGLARQMAIYNDEPERIAVSWFFTFPEWQFFQAWLKYDINRATAWFTMPILINGTLEEREVRFVASEVRQTSLAGAQGVTVTALLETRQETPADEVA